MQPSTQDADVEPARDADARLAATAEEAVQQLGDLLLTAVRALGDAGEVEQASKLAARGWWAVRDVAPQQAARLNGILHHLARLDGADRAANTTPSAPAPTTPAPDPELDVRSDPPARRHDLILSTYAQLAPGDGFILINDHDPKPLYYQFAAEHAGAFTWDYLETGPEVWRVRIGRPPAA